MQKYSLNELKEGQEFELGTITLSEQEIIDFAKAFDPLDFHTDREAAKNSMFKGLVASGPHIFTLVHRVAWIPRFGHTVLAGLEVTNWKFLKPVYPGRSIHSTAKVTRIKPNPAKGYAAVTWMYLFIDENNEPVQTLEMTVLHKMD